MTFVFTDAESSEIDRRIVELLTLVMGDGRYAAQCRTIAETRAAERARRNGDRCELSIELAQGDLQRLAHAFDAATIAFALPQRQAFAALLAISPSDREALLVGLGASPFYADDKGPAL